MLDGEYEEGTPEGQRVFELTRLINTANHKYHVEDNPEITDAEFDALLRELNALETKYPHLKRHDSPTGKVGGLSSSFAPVKMEVPMLSLKNGFADQDLADFVKRCTTALGAPPVFHGSLKFDGLAVNLRYNKGKLVQANTRGDGTTGEDITENVKQIDSIPKQLKRVEPFGIPAVLEVRGEIMMLHSEFDRINRELLAMGKRPYANCRNAAAGSVRTHDVSITASRKLVFRPYGVGMFSAIRESVLFHSNLIHWFENMGFTTSGNIVVTNDVSVMMDYIKTVKAARENIPFDIDGVVFKVDSISDQVLLGGTTHSPRAALAFKLPPEEVETFLDNIEIQIGRTGKATPVARLRPVAVGGVIVSNATLHNLSEIQRKDLRIGDYVVVRRAGDVVPEVVRAVLEKRLPNVRVFEMPERCPICNSELVRPEGEVDYRCVGGINRCNAQLKGTLLHFVSRDAADIDGIGEELVSELVDKEVVTTLTHLFDLNETCLKRMKSIAPANAEKVVQAIEKARKGLTLHRLIYGLGIRHVGLNTAKLLAKEYETFDDFFNAGMDRWQRIPGVGEVTAKAIKEFFPWRIKNSWLDFFLETVEVSNPLYVNKWAGRELLPGKFDGKKFVITGTMPSLLWPREAVIERIESYGGTVTDSVSKKTDYLIVGQHPGSSLKKAEELGTKIVTFDEFLTM